MKKTITAKPSLRGWKMQLRAHLKKMTISSKFKKLDPDWREGAFDGIVAGVTFCIQKDLPIIPSTLARDFDMGSENRCLLAKAGQTTLKQVCSRFKLNLADLEEMECTWCRASPSDSSYTTYWTWEEIANFLWRATGRFFKEHPECGVN